MSGLSTTAKNCGQHAEERESPWHALLYTRLRGQAHPLFVSEEGILPAASLWAGTRLWIAAFRHAGLHPGDRVVLALPPSAGFLCAFLAGLWEGLTLAVLPPKQNLEHMIRRLDASASIGSVGGETTWRADACGLPRPMRCPLRSAQTAPTPEARLLLSTSGTTAAPRWVALSDTNLRAIIESHLPRLGLTEARLLSVLPWHHAFGLVIDLLPALLSGAEIIRDETGGRSPSHLVELMNTHEITHLNAVPLTIERLFQTPGGPQALQRLQGGVVGGAPVDPSLSKTLGSTQMRVGYGQTEASPGITLGEPGHWEPGYLGQPVGCAVQVNPDGHLQFSGPNACLGIWGDAGLEVLAADRWVDTGDIVEQKGQDLYFRARTDTMFKLNNGRPVQAGLWESTLRERAPYLQHVLLYTPDGEHLSLLVDCAPHTPSLPLSEAQRILGPLGTRLCTIHAVSPEQWARTPKGEVDRQAMLQGRQTSSRS